MPFATHFYISSQAAMTIPALVPGRTERRERTWISSKLAFLRRGGGFESIGTDLLPHLLRQWGGPTGTPNLKIFAFCNRFKHFVKVCNIFRRRPASATVCNRLQQPRAANTPPRQPKPGSGT